MRRLWSDHRIIVGGDHGVIGGDRDRKEPDRGRKTSRPGKAGDVNSWVISIGDVNSIGNVNYWIVSIGDGQPSGDCRHGYLEIDNFPLWNCDGNLSLLNNNGTPYFFLLQELHNPTHEFIAYDADSLHFQPDNRDGAKIIGTSLLIRILIKMAKTLSIE
ncbi:hypothetical protein Acr_24g0014840 [Actinidia rufa]|uniref:Uncharacterized protein n=1 Tax=Actinidia rufa TaxID=165716 RepID=A0A7J0GXK9_9ERIC|nr:hypothetical protein Acr_24g0014840 [Actinidia rufa]